jgi:hypothetical protein
MMQMKNTQKLKKLKKKKTLHKLGFFSQDREKMKMEKYAFCVITVWPIKIYTCSAPQNDRLKLIFVELAKKRLQMVVKWTFVSSKF